ncbi:hypothetical protein Pelo_13969 [Pelomyxa schiedti]|nr:hypothetical protein Pelo_13969 [Pelomyxa schiedti]
MQQTVLVHPRTSPTTVPSSPITSESAPRRHHVSRLSDSGYDEDEEGGEVSLVHNVLILGEIEFYNAVISCDFAIVDCRPATTKNRWKPIHSSLAFPPECTPREFSKLLEENPPDRPEKILLYSEEGTDRKNLHLCRAARYCSRLTNVHEVLVLQVPYCTFVQKYPFLCTNNGTCHIYPSQVAPSVFLGSFVSASDATVLGDLGIKWIINCAAECENVFEKVPIIQANSHAATCNGTCHCNGETNSSNGCSISTQHNTLDSHINTNGAVINNGPSSLRKSPGSKEWHVKYNKFAMLDENDYVINFFKEATNIARTFTAANENCLVHCYQGRSRSASVVAAILMALHGLSSETACEMVRQARNIVQINPHYIKQLALYDAELTEQRAGDTGLRESNGSTGRRNLSDS